MKKRAIWLIVPTVVVLLLVVGFPIVYSLIVSFQGYDLRIPNHPFIGFNNYIHVIRNSEFHNSLKVTGLLLAGELVIEIPFGFLIALLLIRVPKGRKFFQPILLLPMMIMPVVIGYMGRLIFETRSGPANYFLSIAGLGAMPWHTSPHTALLTVLLLRVWRWIPFVMAVILAGLLSLPKEPYESAKVDGASSFQIFRYITLPLLKPVLTLIIIMRTLETMTSFDIVYVLTAGGPGDSTEIISLFTYLRGFRYWDIGQGAAAAWMVTIAVFLLVLLFVKFMEREEREKATNA